MLAVAFSFVALALFELSVVTMSPRDVALWKS